MCVRAYVRTCGSTNTNPRRALEHRPLFDLIALALPTRMRTTSLPRLVLLAMVFSSLRFQGKAFRGDLLLDRARVHLGA